MWFTATTVDDGLFAIPRQLPPPFEKVSVRQIVNRLAVHGGQCAVWILGGSRDFRTFGFFNTYRCSNVPPHGSPSYVDGMGDRRELNFLQRCVVSCR